MVILTRAGLGLDAAALRRLSLVVLRLAFSPCLSETLTVGVAAHLLLGFPWIWGFMLGCVPGRWSASGASGRPAGGRRFGGFFCALQNGDVLSFIWCSGDFFC